jgi:hypothetical protein
VEDVNVICGKHNEIKAPHNNVSFSFNYKKTFSVVLLALVGRNYKFTKIEVSGYGKSSDEGLFTRQISRKSLLANRLNILNSKPPPKSEETLPFLIVGDEAFPLKKYLFWSYAGISALNDESKQIYSYRLSRTRRVVENVVSNLEVCHLRCVKSIIQCIMCIYLHIHAVKTQQLTNDITM